MANHEFFQNTACEYFPCHRGVEIQQFNCLFCYCPLYALGDRCGGDFTYTEGGIKDCSDCLRPHQKHRYPEMLEEAQKVLEMAKNT